MLIKLLIIILYLFETILCGDDSKIFDYGPYLRNGDEYDFIVVGAGSAGSVVANRLSEISNWSILVLEAGKEPSFNTQVPGLFLRLINSSESWVQKSEVQPGSCLGSKNKQCLITCGKVLGGSSSINLMIYVRGNPNDYNEWAKSGNPGWDWNSVLPYFIKSENNINFWNNYKFHGKDGYLTVYKHTNTKAINTAILKAAKEMGWRSFNDLHDGTDYSGFGDIQTTIKNGTRCSTYEAFLKTAKNRSNFHLAGNAFVTKVLIDNACHKAIGVEVVINGKTLKIYAKKEVIVSAGALSSPKILMLSGIGPKEDLERLQIKVVKPCPVGENLQDHLLLMGLILGFNDTDWISRNLQEELGKWERSRTGTLSNLGFSSFMGFINTKNGKDPNIQIVNLYSSMHDAGKEETTFATLFDFEDVVVNSFDSIFKKTSLISPIPILLHPKSRGSLKLRNTNPYDPPSLTMNYLTEEEDVDTLIDAIEYIEKIYMHEALLKFNTTFNTVDIPNPNNYKFKSREYWEWFIRNMGTSLYHYVGTCKMGPPSDEAAVVDSRLRVYGVRNLRVIDNSIMPNIVGGNTNAPAIMIGEKGADMIKEDYGYNIN